MRFLLIFIALLSILSPAARAAEAGIAAVVNQDAISRADLDGRLRLVVASSGLPDSPETRARLIGQVMDSLIDEQLMQQEAKKRDVSVTDAEVAQGFAQLAQNNKLTPDQFQQAIEHAGIDINTMRRQIRAQLGWSKVIQKVLRPQITVTDADIDEFLAHLNASKGKTEYLIAEILLPVDSPSEENNVRALAAKLVADMRAGKAPFFKVAQQFSKAAGAQQGGDRGWIQEDQLPQELGPAVKALKKMELSQPVRSAAGYHIVLLRDTRQITDESVPPRDQVLGILGIQRLERAQRKYLMDLRSSAFIENRVQS